MSIELIIMLALLILLVFCFIFIEPILSKHKINNKNEHGSARFSKVSEIKINFQKSLIMKNIHTFRNFLSLNVRNIIYISNNIILGNKNIISI